MQNMNNVCIECGMFLDFNPYMIRDNFYFCPNCNKVILINNYSSTIDKFKEQRRLRYINRKKKRR